VGPLKRNNWFHKRVRKGEGAIIVRAPEGDACIKKGKPSHSGQRTAGSATGHDKEEEKSKETM